MTQTFSWPDNYQAAVSLSYDDGLSCHHKQVAPCLESFGFYGTFYVPITSTIQTETDAWRALAQRGHELGNHSCFHPCRKDANKDWLEDGYDLKSYSSRRWCEEMRAANFTLSLIDGLAPTQRSFGNTCNDTCIGPDDNSISLDPFIDELFVAGRGGGEERSINVHEPVNMNNLGNRVFDLMPIDQCIAHLEQTLTNKHWQIVEIHGVGTGTHNLFVEEHDHHAICQYLADHPQIWVAPVREIACYVRSQINS